VRHHPRRRRHARGCRRSGAGAEDLPMRYHERARLGFFGLPTTQTGEAIHARDETRWGSAHCPTSRRPWFCERGVWHARKPPSTQGGRRSVRPANGAGGKGGAHHPW
jgi:hypothetical protein